MFLTFFELFYFYGRSHENNLLNISGVLIFFFFVTFIPAAKENRIYKYLLYSTIAFITTLDLYRFSEILKPIKYEKYNCNTWSQYFSNHQLYCINNDIATLKNFMTLNNLNTNDIFVISDPYIRWKLNIKDSYSYYSPFQANINNLDVINILYKLSKDKKRIILANNVYINFRSYLVELLRDSNYDFEISYLKNYGKNSLVELKISNLNVKPK